MFKSNFFYKRHGLLPISIRVQDQEKKKINFICLEIDCHFDYFVASVVTL